MRPSPFALLLAAGLTWQLLRQPGVLSYRDILPGVTLIVATCLICRLGLLLKRVKVNEHSLYIADYFTEIVVPLRGVNRVAHVPLFPWLVTISLGAQTVFGSRIWFTPRGNLSWAYTWLWKDHPDIAELKKLAKESGQRETAG